MISPDSRLDLSTLTTAVDAIRAEVGKVIVGQHQTVDLLLTALLADGHVLIEGVPGVAKTLTAKLLAKTVSVGFSRIQFTPDLMQLFSYVRRGNNVLISAYDLIDTLGGATGFKADVKDPTKADATLRQNFVNGQLSKPSGYNFFHNGRNFLTIRKPQNITMLGCNARREPVFVRIRYGQVQFLVHNLPLAFTNYYVLDPKTSDYTAQTSSYLPTPLTYWDEYQKQGRFDKAQ